MRVGPGVTLISHVVYCAADAAAAAAAALTGEDRISDSAQTAVASTLLATVSTASWECASSGYIADDTSCICHSEYRVKYVKKTSHNGA